MVAWCFAACSIGVDFDAYSNGVVDAARASDVAQVPDSALTDAGDAKGPGFDAGFCPDANAVTLCDDFDGKRTAGWTNSAAEGGGMVGISDAAATSLPNSLLASSPIDAGTGAGGIFYKYVNANATSAVVEADVKACHPDSGLLSFLYFIEEAAPTAAVGVAFDGAPKTFAFAGSFPHYVPTLLPTDRFVHVKWTIQFHPSDGSMNLEIDGVNFTLEHVSTSVANAATRAFQAGAYSLNGAACSGVHIDNLMVDVK